MTIKLYDKDSQLSSFTAKVLLVEDFEDGYGVYLDQTAFFPEGGGQKGDVGHIGAMPVLDTRENDKGICHYMKTAPKVGADVLCEIDWGIRFARMQKHSGEHVFSGLAHSKFGCENVGFHMDEDTVTMDYDKKLRAEDVGELERLSNEIIWENRDIHQSYPSGEVLAGLHYRSKLEDLEALRIVTVEGCDCCACCAPHVKKTGEIGVLKVLDFAPHRGGTRIVATMGSSALTHYVSSYDILKKLGQSLSLQSDRLGLGIEKLKDEAASLKKTVLQRERAFVQMLVDKEDFRQGNFVAFAPSMERKTMVEMANFALEKCTGFAAIFVKEEKGYAYVLASHEDMDASFVKDWNAKVTGTGGGRGKMIQGNCLGGEEEILGVLKGSEK